MHRHGHGVFAWTVDDEDEMRRLIACDVNGIVTNRPAALAEVIRDLQTSVVARLAPARRPHGRGAAGGG